MTINGKTVNIEFNDMLEAGKAMEIRANRCRAIINDVQQVVGRFSEYAAKAGLRDATTGYISSVISRNSVTAD